MPAVAQVPETVERSVCHRSVCLSLPTKKTLGPVLPQWKDEMPRVGGGILSDV